MTTSSGTVDGAWAKLAEQPVTEREAQMLTRYNLVAELPDDGRENTLLAMARAEYALPHQLLRDFTLSRMRVLLKMSPVAANRVALSYAKVMDRLPATAAMARITLIQTLAREFTPEDEALLREMNPGAFGGMPGVKPVAAETRAPTPPPQPEKKKGWGFLGRK